jgi:hypothetical protein
LWEKVELPVWRGKENVTKPSNYVSYNEDYYLIKQEMTHDGRNKLILKDKKTGKISEQDV